MRDVRDVDADAEAAARKLLGLDRVIEIARGLTVDRDDRPPREVRPEHPLVGPDRTVRSLGLGDHGLGILPGNSPLAGHDLDVDARVALETDQIQHLGQGEPAVVGIRGDARLHEDARRGRHVLAVRHREPRVYPAVERHDERALRAARDLSDDRFAAPLQDLHDDA